MQGEMPNFRCCVFVQILLRIRDGVGEVVGDGCLSLDVGTRALYIGLGLRDVIGVWNPICET